MGNTDQHVSSGTAVVPTLSFPAVLIVMLVSVYSVAQGATVLRDLIYPQVGAPATVAGAGNPTVSSSITSFGTLAGNLAAGAPIFVLLVLGVAGFVVYRGRSLADGLLLSSTLTLGVFVGVTDLFELLASARLPFLVTSAALLGVFFGGCGALLGAGARYSIY